MSLTPQIIITRTETTAELDGVPCRLWRGTGPDRAPYDVWVHRIGTDDPAGQEYLGRDCNPVDPPARIVPRMAEVTRDQLREAVAWWIVADGTGEQPTRAQAAVGRAVRACHEDGEDGVAYSLILLILARSMGGSREALKALSQALHDLEAEAV